MPRRELGAIQRKFRIIGMSWLQYLQRFSIAQPIQVVGIFLFPFEGTFFTINGDGQTILFASRYLTASNNALNMIIQTNQDRTVNIHLVVIIEVIEVTQNGFYLKTGSEFNHIESVHTDITHARTNSSFLRV